VSPSRESIDLPLPRACDNEPVTRDSSSSVSDVALDRSATALLQDLAARGIPYVLLRPAAESDGGLGTDTVLVLPRDVARVDLVAGGAQQLDVVTRLVYGRPRVGTGEPEERIVARAVCVEGVMMPSPADELIDLFLHCVLDLGRFPARHRMRLAEIVAHLRMNPPSAGHAAERTQYELAPAITWDALLAGVLHERWDDLLARQRRIRIRLFARRPTASLHPHRGRPIRTPPHTNGVERPDTGQPARGGPAAEGTEKLNRRQIRGSGLLLAGRGLSSGLKFLAELLIVRYLSTAAYGSWTWALSAVVLLESFSTMGLNRAIPRFIPLHWERGERQELFGVLLFVLGSLLAVGLLFVTVFFAFPAWVAGLAGASPGQSLDILFIVIFLLPIHAVGNFFTVLCAALGDSRSIFVRRYIFRPGLQLAVALVLVLMEADVRLLAYGWLLSSLAGVLYYSVSVFLTLRRRGLLSGSLDLHMPLPVRRVFAYTLPVMASDWFRTLMTTPAPLLLGYFSGMSTVALYQVVIPLVGLNTQVSQTFVMMFEPSASRVLARGDRAGLENLYWRAAAWVALLSFPGFALSFAMAEPVTSLLYGERYQAAAAILSVLAVGMFLDAAMGFNDAALRVSGNIRWLMGVNVVGAVINVGLNLLLIPSMGALGAGIATGTAMLIYALLKQYCLWRATGVRGLHPSVFRFYTSLALVVAGLAVLRVLWPSNLWVLLPSVVLAGLALALVARSTLSISDTFPELARWPLLKRVLG
jgi:O-antigen/teichoic acid export membrane protein